MMSSADTEFLDPDVAPATAPPAHERRRLTLAVLAVLAVAAVVGLAVLAFAWPAARLAPRDLPIALSGPEAAVVQVQRVLEERQPGAFYVVRLADAGALDRAVRDRTVYGGLDLDGGVSVRTASAASPAVAQLLATLGEQVATSTGQPYRVTDVVRAPSTDPRGAAFGSALLPLVLAGEVAAVLLSLAVRPGPRLAGALVVTTALAGATTLWVTRTWLGVLPHHPWATWGALSLVLLAVAATVTGLAALLGRPGLGVAAVVMVFVGNPWSGATSAPELLPAPAGTLGQLLPPGAGASLVRSTTFFDGAGAGGPLAVLLTWAALGLVVTALPLRRRPAGAADGRGSREVSASA